MALPELVLEDLLAPRVLGLCTRERLEPSYASVVYQHYSDRGCIVVDMDRHAEPLAQALPLMTSPEMWTRLRIELLRGLMYQLHQVTQPVVFLNMRAGPEMEYLQEMLPGSSTSLYHVITNQTEVTDSNFIPVLDLTQVYPHVLDSLL
jgi:hypothetical protein